MNDLGQVLSKNLESKINEEIKDAKNNGFMVFCHNGEMTIKSRIHPWRNNHKGKEMQKQALKNLQKEIGGKYIETVFDPELVIDVSNITSVRCTTRPEIFAFKEYVTIETKIKDDGTIIVPNDLIKIFKAEFPSLSFEGENAIWNFVEYDGGYPSLCSGDTILCHGSSIVRTKILTKRSFEWKVEIPSLLKDINIPKEIWVWENTHVDCCGGCE